MGANQWVNLILTIRSSFLSVCEKHSVCVIVGVMLGSPGHFEVIFSLKTF